MLGHRSLNLDDYVGILKRRWWIILIPLVILPIITVAFSYTISPQYMSQTLVLVEGQQVAEGIVKPVITTDLDSRLASMKEQILSRSSIQPIIDRYNLYADKKLSMDDRIDITRKNIEIKTIAAATTGSGSLPGFFISFKSGDPHTAQQVCTEITSLFTNENLKARSNAAEGTVEFLKSQLADAKRALDEQDAKLAQFQTQYMGRLPSEEGANSSMLSSLNGQLDATTQALQRMQQDKSLAESMLASQLATQSSAATVAGVPAVPGNSAALDQLQALQTERTELLTHYTADHPDVIALDRRIAEARRLASRPVAARGPSGTASRPENPAVQQLRAQIQAATIGIESKRKEQSQIQGQIGQYQSRLMASPAIEQQYKQLTRDSSTALDFYNDLRNKINGAQMGTDLEKRQQGEQFRLMDAANLPEAPFSPKRSVFLAGGVAGGLAIGLIIIAALEFKDTAIRNERDVWAFMELPLLTTISLSDDVPVQQGGPGRNWLGRILLRRVRRAGIPEPAKV